MVPSVQHFLQTTPPPSGSDTPVVRDCDAYVEILYQSPGDPSDWFAGYLIKVEDDMCAVTCPGSTIQCRRLSRLIRTRRHFRARSLAR